MMKIKPVALAILPIFLSACATAEFPGFTTGEPKQVDEVPESVTAAAASYQDLSNLRIQPEDGCYWWQWVGPVETTYLPLVTPDGRRICTR